MNARLTLGMGTAVEGLVLATVRFRRDHDVDLGSVSHRWLAGERMAHGHESWR